MKKYKAIFYILISIAWVSTPTWAQSKKDFETSKSIDIFVTLLKELNRQYVDTVNLAQLTEDGINAMLDKLDPYTVYIPESEIDDYKFMTTGEYGGIGALIVKKEDGVYISEPYEGMPAYKAGLKAGDKFLKVNDIDVNKKNVQDVTNILKGTPGTSMTVMMQRYGEANPLNIKVTREKVVINPVIYSGIIGNSAIGYIKLTTFTQNAADDVKKAFVKLKKQAALKGLILDLRDNGGGLLNEAVDIVNLFVKKSELVVSTKGKLSEKNRNYKTTNEPVDLNIPLAVLVNGSSASASEIVAGALQDLDRAVVIGRRTFGKGLVQNIIPLNYNTQVKMTIAKYYTPSGRCIQAIDYTHKDKNNNPDVIPDSLIKQYQTVNGRLVSDGKGIQPDMLSDTVRTSPIIYNLVLKHMIFDYATKYAWEHKSIAPADQFSISSADFQDFVKFTEDKKFDYKTKSELALLQVKKAVEADKTWDEIKPEFELIEKSIKENKKKDFLKNKTEITDILNEEIASRYYYQKGRVLSYLQKDDDIKRAIDVLINQSYYTSILNGTANTLIKKK